MLNVLFWLFVYNTFFRNNNIQVVVADNWLTKEAVLFEYVLHNAAVHYNIFLYVMMRELYQHNPQGH